MRHWLTNNSRHNNRNNLTKTSNTLFLFNNIINISVTKIAHIHCSQFGKIIGQILNLKSILEISYLVLGKAIMTHHKICHRLTCV